MSFSKILKDTINCPKICVFYYIEHRRKLKPLADIQFKYTDNKAINFPALVDSGADRSCSFVSIGEKLGVDFSDYDEKDNVATGISGADVPGYIAPISFFIGDYEITLNVAWMDIPFDAEKHYFFILGRERFFEEFDVIFQESKTRIVFKKV